MFYIVFYKLSKEKFIVEMISKFINKLFSNRIHKDSSTVLAGTALNITAGGLFFIFAPRFLGPVNYGLFSTVIATGLFATSIANFGIDTGILKFTSDNSKDSAKFLSLAFKLYIASGLITSIIGIFLSGFIANLLNQPQISFLLVIAFSSTIFLLLTNFYVAALQAKKEFVKAALVSLSSNVVRILILLTLSLILTLSLNIITILFFFVTILSVITGKIFLPIKLENTQKKDLSAFFKFNVFIAASLIISSIPFDNFILLKLAGPLYTGLYAAPLKFLTFSYQFGGNFSKVIATDLFKVKNNQDLLKSVKNSAPVIILFITGLIVIFICSPIVNKLFFGQEFIGSEIVMRILLIGFAFFFLSIIPSAIILYYFGKSQISFYITLVKYTVYIFFLFLLIPNLKSFGAAWAFSISEIVAFILMSVYILKKLYFNNVA